MVMKMRVVCVATLGLLVQVGPLDAQTATKNYAQELVDNALARHRDVLVLMMHVTPPGKSENVVIASNIGRIGKAADEDDLAVIKTGQAKLEVNKTGDRFEVELPLQDVSQRTIGALGIVFPYGNGQEQGVCQRKAEQIRNELRRRISTAANLVEPADWDPKIPKHTYAQTLVDQALDQHSDALILAMHVTPPNSQQNVIVASNIGRIGKKADEDDMSVITTGAPKLEVNAAGDRFEDELALLDASGNRVGAIGIVFAYRQGDDQAALAKKAEQIRNELRGKIRSRAQLFDPAR